MSSCRVPVRMASRAYCFELKTIAKEVKESHFRCTRHSMQALEQQDTCRSSADVVILVTGY